jgi:hypothetical protein
MRWIVVVIAFAIVAGCDDKPPAPPTPATNPAPATTRASGPKLPHATALQMVLDRCGEEIDAIEMAGAPPMANGDIPWWFDVKPREWSVQRPIRPGFVDSTHWFDVEYRIDGKVVAKWNVDTRAGTVHRTPTTQPSP